jgi:hypothetical protein
MAQLRQDYQQYVDRNTEVIAIDLKRARCLSNGGMNTRCRLAELLIPGMSLLMITGSKSS